MPEVRPPGAASSDAPPPARPRPQSLSALFIAFTVLALQGFGGVAAVVQRELVERRQWLTREEFMEEWAVAQIMPGPNVVNLSLMIGARYFGMAGAFTAVAGMLTMPLVIILLMVVLHARYATHPGVAGALRGMAAVSAGMLGAAGLKLASALAASALPRSWCVLLCVAGFALVALLRVPLPYVLLGVGGLGFVLTYRRLRA